MTEPSTLKKLSELAAAAETLFQYGLITLDEGQRIAQGIFDGRVQAYEPLFMFFPTDGTIPWQNMGWLEDGLEPGLESLGKIAIEFIQSKPEYNSTKWDDDKKVWIVCTHRGSQDVNKPPPPAKVQKPSPPPTDATEAPPEPPPPAKKGPGRPKKNASPPPVEPPESKPDATPEQQDIPF